MSIFTQAVKVEPQPRLSEEVLVTAVQQSLVAKMRLRPLPLDLEDDKATIYMPFDGNTKVVAQMLARTAGGKPCAGAVAIGWVPPNILFVSFYHDREPRNLSEMVDDVLGYIGSALADLKVDVEFTEVFFR